MVHPRTRFGPLRLALFTAVLLLSPWIARSASAASSTLTWTSPGDNGGAARVYYYDLRISMKAVAGTDTLGWWNAATKIPMAGRTPALPGQLESILLAGLVNGVRYYAILKSADSQLNWSRYSNVATFVPVTSITAAEEGEAAPAVVLGIPRPTPTSGRSDVNLELPRSMDVQAAVFNAQGRKVRTLESGTLPAGTHVLHWDGRLDSGGDAASGVYWIRVGAGTFTKTVKLIVAR